VWLAEYVGGAVLPGAGVPPCGVPVCQPEKLHGRFIPTKQKVPTCVCFNSTITRIFC